MRRARAKPSLAVMARRLAIGFVNVASVATITIVVAKVGPPFQASFVMSGVIFFGKPSPPNSVPTS